MRKELASLSGIRAAKYALLLRSPPWQKIEPEQNVRPCTRDALAGRVRKSVLRMEFGGLGTKWASAPTRRNGTQAVPYRTERHTGRSLQDGTAHGPFPTRRNGTQAVPYKAERHTGRSLQDGTAHRPFPTRRMEFGGMMGKVG